MKFSQPSPNGRHLIGRGPGFDDRRDECGELGGGPTLLLRKLRVDEIEPVERMLRVLDAADEFTLSGADPEGLFPAVLGHEGAGIVVDVGPGVTSVKKDDHVIPLYTPECRQCPSCLSRKTNLCTAIRATQDQGVMPDGTSRFSLKGKKLHHYMGTSTFSNFTVLPEIAIAKIREDAPFDKVCYVGCGVTTGIGAVLNTAKVEPGSKCIVFGLGGIGLNVIQGLRLAGADMIIGVDVNNAKKQWGGHRPHLEGDGIRRRARPHRRPQNRRLVHGGQDRDRSDDHAHHAARGD